MNRNDAAHSRKLTNLVCNSLRNGNKNVMWMLDAFILLRGCSDSKRSIKNF